MLRAFPPRPRRPASQQLRLTCAAACLGAWLLLAAGPGHTQALPEGVRFGMTPGELQMATGPLEQMPGVRRTATGPTGSWRGPAVQLAGLPFEQTFVFTRGHLSRIERFASTQALADGGTAVFEQLVASGQRAYGPESRTRDPSGDYASWSLPEQDVYVQHSGTPAGIRVVLAGRAQRDDSTL